MLKRTCRFHAFPEKFSDHIVDIIKCNKKKFFATFRIVIDSLAYNYDTKKDDIILSESGKIFQFNFVGKTLLAVRR